MMDVIELKNELGLRVELLTLGASIRAVYFPDKDGNPVDVALGFDTTEEYEKDDSHFGRTVGRVANRIGHGRFTMNGREYNLHLNNPPHHLHGGPKGSSNRRWEIIRRSDKSATFMVKIRSEEDNYPGDVILKVTYTVSDLNRLIVEHFAKPDAPTVVNLTNHTYWNLDGCGSIRDHELWIKASRYLPVDQHALPTGEIRSVEGTSFDFTSKKKIGPDPTLFIDNDFVLNRHETHAPVLSLESSVSGIRMDVSTSYPVIHLYTANHLHDLRGKGDAVYGPHAGLAIEPQKYTDAPNNPHFPPIDVLPEEPYREEIVYTFCHCGGVSKESSPSFYTP